MKVLLLSHTCQSRTEGQMRPLEMARLGLDVRVVVPRKWKHYGAWRSPDRTRPGDGFTLQILSPRLAWCGPAQNYLLFYPGLGRVLRSFAPDVIDVWEEPWSAAAVQACVLRERICPHVPLVCETEQNVDKQLPPPFEPFRSFVLKRADFFVGRNKESLEILRRKGFSGPSRVVPNAVDAQLFHPLASADKAALRAKLGWADDEWVCGYVGRLVEEKGLLDFLDALAKCSTKVRGVFVGSGPLEERLRARIEELDLERVEILPARPLTELAPLMGALDTLVLPSRTTARWKEQFGRVLIESLACAVPVIGSSSGAIPEVVGETGAVFPEGDATALATILDDWARHRELARRLGNEGRARVEREFTWSRVAVTMKEIFEGLLR